MKLAFAFVALCACERAEPTPAPEPNPDPVQQARAEFELVPGDLAGGTHKLYSRGDFAPGLSIEQQFDEGDFIGRLRTLFGAREGDDYVFRHKQTGYIVTAYSGDSGPSYGGGPLDIMVAMDLIRGRRLPVSEMITHQVSLAETGYGFQLVASGAESIKVIVDPQR